MSNEPPSIYYLDGMGHGDEHLTLCWQMKESSGSGQIGRPYPNIPPLYLYGDPLLLVIGPSATPSNTHMEWIGSDNNSPRGAFENRYRYPTLPSVISPTMKGQISSQIEIESSPIRIERIIEPDLTTPARGGAYNVGERREGPPTIYKGRVVLKLNRFYTIE